MKEITKTVELTATIDFLKNNYVIVCDTNKGRPFFAKNNHVILKENQLYSLRIVMTFIRKYKNIAIKNCVVSSAKPIKKDEPFKNITLNMIYDKMDKELG